MKILCAFQLPFLLALWTILSSCYKMASVEYSLTVAAEDKVSCQGFLSDADIRELIASGKNRAEPCPCQEQIIAIDETFEKIDNCYRQWFFTDDVKQMCCYSKNGQLQLQGPASGYLLIKSKEEYIAQAHSLCCGNGSDALRQSCESFYQINPPDDCRSYEPPVVSISSGDPMITTIDGTQYDFNGHGEYVFLKDNKTFEIQARTEYVQQGNNDSTYFSAFALLDRTSYEQVDIQYVKKERFIKVYRNGSVICNSSSGESRPKRCEQTPHKCFVLAKRDSILIQNCGFGSYIELIEFGTDNFMTVKITKDNRKNTTSLIGLAGHEEEGFFITRNGSKVSENASESELFEFAESWERGKSCVKHCKGSLQNVTESIFMYNLTGGNFTLYNSFRTRPKLLEDKLGNLTALFENIENISPENITQINNTCRNYWDNQSNRHCLLTIAKTGDYSLGVAVMKDANSTRHKWEIIHNRPPVWTTNITEEIRVFINSTLTINLADYVTDDYTSNENLKFRVLTELDKTEYSLDGNGTFYWRVGSDMRYKDEGISFYVFDALNASSTVSLSINFCGCVDVSYCSWNNSNSNSSEKVQKAICQCPKYISGLYCEIVEDPCKDYNCTTTCNKTLDRGLPSWPCEPCLVGYVDTIVGKQQTCDNINECEKDPKPCDHICNDTDGSYVCSCNKGYSLDTDKHSCKDVDECRQDSSLCPRENEVCLNTQGNYSCACVPGFNKLSQEGTCKKQKGPQYVGHISFVMDVQNSDKVNATINTPENRFEMQKQLTVMFNRSTSFESVEVFQISVIGKQRRKRDVNHISMKVDFIVHCKNNTGYSTIENQIQELAKKLTNNTIDFCGLKLDVMKAVIHVNNEKEGGICTVPNKNDCDKESTVCKDGKNGEPFSCICKTGFEPVTFGKKYCKDIHECEQFKGNHTVDERCIHGECVNTIGSWNCTCDKDKLWKNIGNKSYPVYRCQGNYSYIGNISVADHNSSSIELIKDFVRNQLKKLFKDPKNENGTDVEPMRNLFVSAEVLGCHKNLSARSFNQYNVEYILRIGESVTSERVSNILKNVLSDKEWRIRNGSQDIAFDKNSSHIFSDIENKLCAVTSNGLCDKDTTICRQRNGSTTCECKDGFENKLGKSSKYCTDVNECLTNSCNNETCVNSFGNWTCKCKHQFFVPDQNDKHNFSCKGISACEYKNRNFNCIDGNRTCQNDTRKWKCSCKQEISACEYKNSNFNCINGNRTCQNDTQEWKCSCKQGFAPVLVGKNTMMCQDINECTNDSYYCGGTCHNTLGSWTCECKDGYTKESNNGTKVSIKCEDINECGKDEYKCVDGTCVNQEGSWLCVCEDGIQQEHYNSTVTVCKEISACEYKNSNFNCINGNRTCQNDTQEWKCSCEQGEHRYLVTTEISVVKSDGVEPRNSTVSDYMKAQIEIIYALKFPDKDVRVDIISITKSNGGDRKKRQTTDSYNVGYKVKFVLHIKEEISHEEIENVWKDFVDRNCSKNNCSLSKGNESYNFRVSYEDKAVVETDQSTALCGLQKYNPCNRDTSICQYINGKAYCKCKEGFVKKSTFSCEEISACEYKNSNFNCINGNRTCQNDTQEWKCSCKQGFAPVLVGKNTMMCQDINECTNDSYYCGGTCHNTLGSWTCECKDGYTKESNNGTKVSIKCEDINECGKDEYKCVDGTCVNQEGSWLCVCEDGKQQEHYNSTVTVCKDGYRYMLMAEISVVAKEDVDPFKLKIYVQAQIKTIYASKFPDKNVRVEIISVTNNNNGKRTKRRATDDYKVEFVLQINEQILHGKIESVWKDFVENNCFKTTCSSPKGFDSYKFGVILDDTPVIEKNQTTALCSQPRYNHCDRDKSICQYINGSANCICKYGYIKKSNLSCEVTRNVCEKVKPCKHGGQCQEENNDFTCVCNGGWTGKYCENDTKVTKTDAKTTTTFIAMGSSFGAAVIILVIVIIIMYRSKSKKNKKAEKMSLKQIDQNGFKDFDGSFLGSRYPDNDDEAGSFYSHRLSNSSMPYRYQKRMSQSGEYSRHQNGFVPNGLYSSPIKLPRPNIHGSMPDLANIETNFNQFDIRRYSGDDTRRVSSYNQDLNRSYVNDLRTSARHWNRMRSPSPDYGRPRSPKPDYNPVRTFNRSKDSGVGNGNSSESNEYYRKDNRRTSYYNGQRQSTNF